MLLERDVLYGYGGPIMPFFVLVHLLGFICKVTKEHIEVFDTDHPCPGEDCTGKSHNLVSCAKGHAECEHCTHKTCTNHKGN